jgi:hypothetical protein
VLTPLNRVGYPRSTAHSSAVDLKVTLRYMHLTETALRDTMRLLEQRGEGPSEGGSGAPDGEVTAR